MVSPLNPETIADAAMKLPPDRRAALAERLWRSLDGVLRDDQDSPWDLEIQRRIDEARKDPSILVDGDEVLRKLDRGECP